MNVVLPLNSNVSVMHENLKPHHHQQQVFKNKRKIKDQKKFDTSYLIASTYCAHDADDNEPQQPYICIK